ncbi:MAG: AAA family ATPase [Chitinivibrionales bacterium]|nr:AAA family ATPase [Chitinivibrionales bacterium]
MPFIADIHIHSPYSRATSKSLSLESLYQWACIKGISLVGTGDCTHPTWLETIKQKLSPDENGLLRLKKTAPPLEGFEKTAEPETGVRFMLTCEISNIYKFDGKTRKVHNLICMPDFDSATRFSNALDRIGNIRSDGRPILGLDSRDLLEIMLEVSSDAVLIPAHVWTPWFSVLGSKSGFDSIEECYRDLSDHIFAVETGLSSDPPMNWRVSSLDRYTLVSNSDAHSASKLGREANRFECALSYHAVMNALRNGSKAGYRGTLEFFPEEGKYHYDGHRKCEICFAPEQSREHNGQCPSCGKKLTLGVMYRVTELADRKPGARPENAPPYTNILSLDNVLSEIMRTGPSSKRVMTQYRRLVQTLGPELEILLTIPLEEIRSHSSEILEEAISRLRNGKIHASPGFDGEFGTIKVFEKNELERIEGRISLFAEKTDRNTGYKGKKASVQPMEVKEKKSEPGNERSYKISHTETKKESNTAQDKAIRSTQRHIMVTAGPGTGKTRTLVERIISLVVKNSVPPRVILATTFSNRASQEMARRVENALEAKNISDRPHITTFHKLGYEIITENLESLGFEREPVILTEQEMQDFFIHASLSKRTPSNNDGEPETLEIKLISIIKNDPRLIADIPSLYAHAGPVFGDYLSYKKSHCFLDFTDLLILPLSLFSTNTSRHEHYQNLWNYIFVDEFQDINILQYQLLRLLAQSSKNLFVIGDPDQAIYGFRGSDVGFFSTFTKDYPDLLRINLTRSYRSTRTILDAGNGMIGKYALADRSSLWSPLSGPARVKINEFSTENAEAEHVLMTIEQLIGGSCHFAVDSGRSGDGCESGDIAFRDIAVLYRMHSVGNAIEKALARSGVPVQQKPKTGLIDDKGIRKTLNLLKSVHSPENSFYCMQALSMGIPGIARKTASFYTTIVSESFDGSCDCFEWLANAPEFRSKDSTAFDRIIDCRDAVAAAARSKNIPDAITRAASGLGIPEEKLDNPFWPIILQKAELAGSLGEFFALLGIQKDADLFDSRAEGITLMPLHAAKGLEWDTVFIAGCEDGLLPLTDGDRKPDISEERRLLYVGMTRAKTNLFLSYAKTRRVFGKKLKRSPSPFLSDIPEKLREHKALLLPHRFKRKTNEATQLHLFD